ncbi:hypothetical protein OUZ56_026250 [Daphnia magna]|uniref:Uncharacterized protein n=1 Tax=Daphnia magna TaxID=35525 RepID=A0ABQ9ZLD0_9CRUS|nr:hypothetical protein OUZ56_026250 [Daphnia magna]
MKTSRCLFVRFLRLRHESLYGHAVRHDEEADALLKDASPIRPKNGMNYIHTPSLFNLINNLEHTVPHHVWVGNLKAENFLKITAIRFLLKSEGKINGGADLVSLGVRGNIDVGNNSINGVGVQKAEYIEKECSRFVIQGTKSFSAIEVKNNVTTNTVYEVR